MAMRPGQVHMLLGSEASKYRAHLQRGMCFTDLQGLQWHICGCTAGLRGGIVALALPLQHLEAQQGIERLSKLGHLHADVPKGHIVRIGCRLSGTAQDCMRASSNGGTQHPDRDQQTSQDDAAPQSTEFSQPCCEYLAEERSQRTACARLLRGRPR